MGPKVGLQIRFHGPCKLILKRESSYLHFVNKSSAVIFLKPKYAPNTGNLQNCGWVSNYSNPNEWQLVWGEFFECIQRLEARRPILPRGAICCLRVTLSCPFPLLKPIQLHMKYNNSSTKSLYCNITIVYPQNHSKLSVIHLKCSDVPHYYLY